jgi:hypothetical protein
MNETQILLSNKDTLLFAIPFLFMLFISVFRLDQVIAAPAGAQNRRPACGVDESGETILCDPDGRPSRIRKRKLATTTKIERIF